MLKKLHDVLQLMISLLCILGAIAVMYSDIYCIGLYKLLTVAFMLSVFLGSIPFFLMSKSDKG